MNDWPVWLRTKLKNDPDFTGLLGAGEASIYAAGSLQGPPSKKPFVIVHIGEETRGPFPGRSRTVATLDIHDEPGSYSRIRLLLSRARNALCGMGATQGQCSGTGANGGTVRWLSNSADLSDEGFKTIVRQGEYQLTGPDGED